ncbi:endoglucanase 21-like [Brassica napus]|nr:endoglucanase 21-like [Brassica napus]
MNHRTMTEIEELELTPLTQPSLEMKESWVLKPTIAKKKKKFSVACISSNRKLLLWLGGVLCVSCIIAMTLSKTLPHDHYIVPPLTKDNSTIAIPVALKFFNAQISGKLPEGNNVSWRGDSCLNDGKFPGSSYPHLAGGYYDAGGSIKSNFPMSFSMTMLSWSVIEYSTKYQVAGELNHVKGLIKWGGAWMYYATGDNTYLAKVTSHDLAKRAGAFSHGPRYGVFGWDNKLAGTQLLLTRLRLFLSPPFPYEDMLKTFHEQTSIVMCSDLPYYTKFNRTKGGLILLNHGEPEPLQYAANAAFLATLYSDYLDASDTPGWYCGPSFFKTQVLRDFSTSQVDYILGKNPQNISYVVGFGQKYPKHVHHRGASIPKNKKVTCEGGWKWKESSNENPNTIEGAMVAGPDKNDGFHDLRANYNYTQATLVGNSGLVAALVASSRGGGGLDRNGLFSAITPLSLSPDPET